MCVACCSSSTAFWAPREWLALVAPVKVRLRMRIALKVRVDSRITRRMDKHG